MIMFEAPSHIIGLEVRADYSVIVDVHSAVDGEPITTFVIPAAAVRAVVAGLSNSGIRETSNE